jgi:hypothetical protein
MSSYYLVNSNTSVNISGESLYHLSGPNVTKKLVNYGLPVNACFITVVVSFLTRIRFSLDFHSQDEVKHIFDILYYA